MTGAATPGAGLAPARNPRAIVAGERIHVVGAAGAGASAAVLHAAWAGGLPDGCDRGGPSPYTASIEAAGIPLAWKHDAAHVRRDPPPDRLAVTKALTAIDPDHPELVAARTAGIPIEAWQQVIADAAVGRTLIGIAGTHGKSTSAGWLVHVLAAAGMDPSAFVGALLPGDLTGGLPSTARRGDGSHFVVEADEYAGNFDAYHPALALVTNVEWDHPDVFADMASVQATFESWLRAATAGDRAPTLVANVGHAPSANDLIEHIRSWWPGRIVPTMTIGPSRRKPDRDAVGATKRFASAAGPARAVLGRVEQMTATGTTIRLFSQGIGPDGLIARLPTLGNHNVSNALGVAAAALELGVAPSAVVSGLESFAGVGRRLERKGEVAGVLILDDYGHHPTAIRAALYAVRQGAPGRRVWAVYEPLTYHRTAALLDDFAEALAAADGVAIADIWAGRDRDTTIASAAGLAQAVAVANPRIPVAAPGSVEATASWLAGEVRSGDAVLVMGGGRSYRIAELLVEALARR